MEDIIKVTKDINELLVDTNFKLFRITKPYSINVPMYFTHNSWLKKPNMLIYTSAQFNEGDLNPNRYYKKDNSNSAIKKVEKYNNFMAWDP